MAARDLLAFLAGRVSTFLARRGISDPRTRRLALGAALAVFIGGFVLGVLNLPEVEQEPRWELLLVVGLLGVPLTLALNAAEYQVAAAIASYRVPFADSLRVGVLSTAANMLPIPGAMLVRAHAIRKLGGSYGKIAVSTGVVAVCFVAVTCALASGILFTSGQPVLGALVAGAALLLAALAFAVLMAERTAGPSLRLLLAAAARAAGAIVIKAGRLYLVLIAFGYEAGATQALTLTVAAVIATTLGFFPGGLGAAEVLAAALGRLVGLSAAVGFVASAVDRLISMIGLAVIGSGIVVLDRRRARAQIHIPS